MSAALCFFERFQNESDDNQRKKMVESIMSNAALLAEIYWQAIYYNNKTAIEILAMKDIIAYEKSERIKR